MCFDSSTMINASNAYASNYTTGMQAGASFAGGVSAVMEAQMRSEYANADAEASRDASKQQAEVILRATNKHRAAARAATAGSGAKVDANSLANEQEILAAGETDAAMVILGGERRGRALRLGAKLAQAEGAGRLAGSLFESSYHLRGWRGRAAGSDASVRVLGAQADGFYTDPFAGQ